MKIRKVLLGLSAATALGCAMSARANDVPFPTKTLRLIVPFVPGGATDIVARLTAQGLSERWGQSVIVDNRAGAGGTIGAEIVAKAAADGHTLLFASGSVLTVNQHLYKNLSYDPIADLPGVINVATGPMVVIVGAGSKAASLKDLIAAAGAAPGKRTFGSAGVGTQVHLAAEKLAYAAKVDTVHVPYKGEGAAIVDVASGQIDWAALNLAASIGFIKDGKIRALAVTSRARSPILPAVPSVVEAGYPGAENSGWFGIAVPAKVSPGVTKAIHVEASRIVDQPAFRERLATFGMAPVGQSVDEFRAAIRSESATWAKIVAERKISIR